MPLSKYRYCIIVLLLANLAADNHKFRFAAFSAFIKLRQIIPL
jgi:hypothetical protein